MQNVNQYEYLPVTSDFDEKFEPLKTFPTTCIWRHCFEELPMYLDSQSLASTSCAFDWLQISAVPFR